MFRAIAVIAFVVLGARVALACPWRRHWSPPPPPVIYVPGPPAVVVQPAPAPEPAPAPMEPSPKLPVGWTPRDFGTLIDPTPIPKEFSASELYDQCVGSTAFIVTPLKDGMAMGSGSLIDAERRYVLTCSHVVEEVEQVYVQFPVREKDGSPIFNKKTYIERIPAGHALKGTVLYRDKTRDLALLQLDRLPPGTKALPLARTSVWVGESVVQIGNPAKVDTVFSTARGEVRGVGVADFVVGGGDDVRRIKARMVQVTNPIIVGDSGGPLIDKRGYLIGVTDSGRSGVLNVNNGIDITEVLAFLNEKKVQITEPGKSLPGPDLRPPREPHRPLPGVHPLHVDPERQPEREPAATPDDRAADRALKSAKLFQDMDDKVYYKTKLKQVIAKFPGTEAAKEAKKLLESLK